MAGKRRPVASVETAGRPLVLVKGAGDLASGVALRLVRAGFSVVMTEAPQPTVVRRAVAFAEAVYEGRAQVEGVEGVLCGDSDDVRSLLRMGAVPVIVDPEAHIRHFLGPDLLVDGIMAKRNTGTRIDDAPVVVALGPGFSAGKDAHAVIETKRGPTLGSVITEGEALPNTGIPGERCGFAEERVLRSPRSGVFVALKQIGERIQEGDIVGMVETVPVVSQLGGVLRGILRSGLVVSPGFKLGDVDPRDDREQCFLVSDKALAIAGGVLQAAFALLWAPHSAHDRAATL